MMRKPPLPTYDEVLLKWPDWTVEDASVRNEFETLEDELETKERVRRRVGHFLKFMQDNGLTRKIICANAPDVPNDQVIYLRDITEEGFDLVRAARHSWYKRFDRSMNADPSDVRLLEKALAEIRAKAAGEEKLKDTETKKRPVCRTSTKKRVAKESALASEPPVFVKYDDASWHYEGKFPEDLPNEAAATHTGMFVAWAVLSGLAAEDHVKAFSAQLSQLGSREISPGAYFIKTCDGKFTSDELSSEGNAFARFYFDFQTGKYLQDYERLLAEGLPSTYHVPDTWDSFDRLKSMLDQRLLEWRRA